jgi:hypothetical protein
MGFGSEKHHPQINPPIEVGMAAKCIGVAETQAAMTASREMLEMFTISCGFLGNL